MTKREAAEMLDRLLNGIHPVTGEVLPENHVCAETVVMRALHMGYAALLQEDAAEQTARERERFVPASRENTHNDWTDAEDGYLREAWANGVPVDDMRRELRRTLRNVKCRLVYLDLADYAILERKYQPPAERGHSGLPWYPEEEETVRMMFDAGISPVEIARQLKRSLRAVALRMVSMALLTEEEKDALLMQPQEGSMPS